jgi:hypothetical protein
MKKYYFFLLLSAFLILLLNLLYVAKPDLREIIFGNLNLFTGQFYLGPYSWIILALAIVWLFKRDLNKKKLFLFSFLFTYSLLLIKLKINYRYPFAIFPILIIFLVAFLINGIRRERFYSFLVIFPLVFLNLVSAINEMLVVRKNLEMLPPEVESRQETSVAPIEKSDPIQSLVQKFKKIYIRDVPFRIFEKIETVLGKNKNLIIDWYPIAYYYLDNIYIKRILMDDSKISYFSEESEKRINVGTKFLLYYLCKEKKDIQIKMSICENPESIYLASENFTSIFCGQEKSHTFCLDYEGLFQNNSVVNITHDLLYKKYKQDFIDYLVRDEKFEYILLYNPYNAYNPFFAKFIQENSEIIESEGDYCLYKLKGTN